MKVRWRDNEMLFGALLTVLAIVNYWRQKAMLTPGQIEAEYGIPFKTVHAKFSYDQNILMVQADTVLLFFLTYLAINWLVGLTARKFAVKPGVAVQKKGVAALKTGLMFIGLFAVIAFLLAMGINIATYFGRPYLFSYRSFGLLAIFGYNDTPLVNWFAGFDRACILLGIYALYALLREAITVYVQSNRNRKEYAAMVINGASAVFVFYLLIYWVLVSFDLVHEDAFFEEYFGLVTPVLLTCFYNIYWLFPMAGKVQLFFTARVMLRLLFVTFVCTLPFLAFAPIHFHPLLFIPYWFVQVVVVTPLSWLVWQVTKNRVLRLQSLKQELTRSKADIQFLRSQINPHFLFNVLNTIYGTALQEKAARTAESIQMLGDMMRFMLHDNTSDVIPMQREIEYLQNYIALQSLRIQSSPNITLQTNINTPGCNHNIAPMLLIPFVENAFKHGISLREPSWIKIDLRCDEHNVWFSVHNSMHPRQDNDTEKNRSGIGIVNVKKRLQASYPNKHALVYNAGDREFFVQLNIQF